MEVTVICTGRGAHGRISFDRFDVDGSAIVHIAVRHGRAPVHGDGTAVEDGTEVPITIEKRMIVGAKPSQNEHGTWRWRCASCGRDRPMADSKLRDVLTKLAAAGVSRLDLSELPR
jgi:hypothetical protein